MRIAEAAARCGLSIDTIRYYEKSMLLPAIERGSDGKRRFSNENVEWLTLLSSLRDTGMTMERMRYFARLYQDGANTLAERQRILLEHSIYLEKQRFTLDKCAKLLSYKLKRYEELLGDSE